MKGDYFKILISDKERMAELENSCMIDIAYIYEKCVEFLNKENEDKEFAKKNPELLAALIKSATDIFIHKPR